MRVLEEGLRAPAIDELARLAQFYGVEAAELFGAALKGTDRLVAPMPEPKKPCMCEAMGSEGRAALRRVAQALEVLTS